MASPASSEPASTEPVPQGWLDLFALLPGYDPVATAGPDCWFDAAEADKAVAFFAECLRHVEGELAGKPFILEPWQQAVVGCLFGWKRRDSTGREVRRYRKALLYVPRKNGKTPLAAGIGLYVLFCDPEIGQQDFIAAGDREQAGQLFRQAKGMVEQEPELDERCDLYGGNASAGQSRSIVIEEENSFLRVISADADTKHGGNTHLAVVDELHVQPNRDLVDVLSTSMASQNRRQPLLIFVTTADVVRESICNEVYERACKVRDRILDDPTFLPVIYEARPEDDWTAEATWAKANPNLGVSVSIDYLRQECKAAQENVAFENTYKRLHLNMRTEQAVRALAMDKWDLAAADVEDPLEWRRAMLEQCQGLECMAGLDLGSVSDLTALVLLFKGQRRKLLALPFFWVPFETARLRSRRDGVPYETWIRQGLIKGTPGNGTDYDQVRRDLNALGQEYLIKELAVDRLFQGEQLCTQLAGDGLSVIPFGQGFYSMAAPTKRLLELVIDVDLDHGGNKVLRWMASNLATEEDSAGCLKPCKKKSTEKIDGMVALIMALGRWMLQPEDVTPTITVI